MRYYFENPKHQKELKTALDEWVGTPYRHWAGVKGQGVDCIHFVARAFEDIGLGPFRVERYNKDWHLHNPEELLLKGLRRELNADELPPDDPMNGDVVLYRFAKTLSHSAIYFDGYVYQAIERVGVEKRNWKDKKWFKRRQLIIRVLA